MKSQRTYYLRPIWLGIAGSVLAEFMIFLIWGLFLYPAGSYLAKFLWTVIFCGFGMGAVTGAIIATFIVDRFEGMKAIILTSVITAFILGVACNLLCFTLDSHFFHYFGAEENPYLFIVNGVVMSALGGLLVGWLLFSNKGKQLLQKAGW